MNKFMPRGCLYLNNSGTRWITKDMKFYLALPNNVKKLRKADYYYSFGNFGGIGYRYKGKKYKALPNEKYRGLLLIIQK